MKIIDIHTHIYPDEIALKASASVKEFYDGFGDPTMDGTEGLLLQRSERLFMQVRLSLMLRATL